MSLMGSRARNLYSFKCDGGRTFYVLTRVVNTQVKKFVGDKTDQSAAVQELQIQKSGR